MRKLRVVVRTAAGTLPLVVAAQVMPGCSDAHTRDAGGRGGTGSVQSGGTGGVLPAGGATGGGAMLVTGGINGGGGFPLTGGIPGTGGWIGPGQCYFEVELPEEGTPAEPGQICAATMVPVESNRATRVTLAHDPNNRSVSLGDIEIEADLQPLLVGPPSVELVEVTEPTLAPAAVEMLPVGVDNPLGTGFRVRWARSIYDFSPESMIRATFRVTAELQCEGAETQLLHSATDLHLCGDWDLEWASSGDGCSVCQIIAEMAPSPIVPEAHADDLPLAQALRLRVVELARVSGTVVLLAENDGGAEMEYQWHASAGELRQLAPDVVAWSLDADAAAPLIQAVALGDDGVAVSTFAFNDRVG